MLRAMHRVLRPGGIAAFFVIAVGAAGTGEQRQVAIEAGPPHVETDLTYPDLMEAAGFDRIEQIDVTAAYLETLAAWWREWDAASADVAPLVGADEFEERQANRLHTLDVIRDGLLCRYLVTGVRPSP